MGSVYSIHKDTVLQHCSDMLQLCLTAYQSFHIWLRARNTQTPQKLYIGTAMSSLYLHVRAARMAPNGYDCQFLSEPDDALKCPICWAVARDPRQHEECGKLFCSECIKKYGTHKPCPNCKKTGAHFYKDNKSKQIDN